MMTITTDLLPELVNLVICYVLMLEIRDEVGELEVSLTVTHARVWILQLKCSTIMLSDYWLNMVQGVGVIYQLIALYCMNLSLYWLDSQMYDWICLIY